MENKMKILLATDYSEAGISAELYGIQFAKNTGSLLCLIHVYDKPLDTTPDEPLELSRTRNDLRDAELSILEQQTDF